MSTTLKQDVKERLLPLSVLEKALERFIEILPRRDMDAAITPEGDIEVLSEARGEYKAIGKEPRFRLEFSLPPQAGWYYLEAALVRNNGSREAFIEVDAAGGRSEIPIPTNLRGSVREVFCLSGGVTCLYWHPTKAAGYFSQSRLQIHRISSIESFFRRAYRVAYDLLRFKNIKPAARAGLSWSGAIRNLDDAYRRTVRLRLDRLQGIDYATFIALHDTLKSSDIRAMRGEMKRFRYRPLITLIMLVDDPHPPWFREALAAVSRQVYLEWEILLAGNLSSAPESLAITEEVCRSDSRVRLVPGQGDMSASSRFNAALEHAQGEFLVKLDQHDILPPHALYCLARQLNETSDAAMIYTDHDEIDAAGMRANPCFKPDWNPDLFTSHDYIGSLCLYRTAQVRAAGGYRRGFEGAEDYDLALRYLKNTSSSGIRHVARVLCHKRSTPTRAGNRQAHESGKHALADYFSGTDVLVEDGPADTLYRIRHPLSKHPPLVSIIIPTRDKLDVLRTCIESIRFKTDYTNWEMLIVDNQSVEPQTLDYLNNIRQDKRIRVLQYDRPFNYSAINNLAVQHARGEVIALLNNDVEVITSNWLTEMVSQAIRPEVGAVGAKLLYPDGTVQHAGIVLGIGGIAGHAHRFLAGDAHGYCHRAVVAQNYSAVTGACLLVRRKLYQEVGGLNDKHFHVAFNDVDFCLKLVASGYWNIFSPYALLYHHESISRGVDDSLEKREISLREFDCMKDHWGSKLSSDVAYNNNLTVDSGSFSLRM